MSRINRFANRFAHRYPRIASALGLVKSRRRPLVVLFMLASHVIGFIVSVRAVMDTRTSQGAIAWAVSLNTFPYVAVPAYLVFGDSHFDSYVAARRVGLVETRPVAQALIENLGSREASEGPLDTLEKLSKYASMPVLRGNRAELLVDGEEIFSALFEGIEAAETYVLVQFYIIRDDRLGGRLKELLIRKARSGVRVFLLFDGIGSMRLGSSYVAELRDAGVSVQAFLEHKGKANRYQLNFRNHRKLVIVDGVVAFVGGQNVGNEYVHEDAVHTPWRDLALSLRGPIVKFVQVPFVEDWHWATGELLEDLEWNVAAEAATAGADAVCIPTGPGDAVETCSMMFLTAIHDAQDRLWIASPYFVPDEQIVTALQMAALRGVDVRVLIPEESDNTLVHLSSYSYLEEMEAVGVAILRYRDGFLHRKALLVDDEVVAIGSANLDNRSFRLNFEVTIFVRDRAINADLADVFETDFASSRRAKLTDLTERSFPFRLAVRVARLMAPVQ